jgi:hypothetical protein
VLASDNPAQICGVWNATAKTCVTPMPAGVRPLGSPTAVMRQDGEGFALMTMWYWSDGNGCSKGKTFLTVHMVSTSETVVQVHGEEVGTEPVIGAVFLGAKLVVVRQSGPKTVVLTGLSVVDAPEPGIAHRYRRTTWVEQP